MRTSERSRTIASTLERRADSRALRRTTFAYSSASVTNASLAFGHAKPEASGAAASDTRSLPRANAEKSSTSVGRNPYSAKYCCIVSRRPALSATIATRASVVGQEALQRGQRIIGAAIDLHRWERGGRSSAGTRQFDACEGLERAVELVGGQKQLGGRKQWARLVAAQQLPA